MPPAPVDLKFQQSGSGNPVVILHGLFGSARNWQSVARTLADKFTVITVDLRNHGASPHHSQMDYPALAEDVGALLAKLALHDVTLIGHSMGGKTAMTLALSKPERIGQLVIVDIGPGSYSNDYDEMLSAMVGLDLGSVRHRADADEMLKSAVPETDIRLFILQNLLFSRDPPPHWRINLEAIRDGISNLVGAIACQSTARFDGPTTFVRGARSDRVGERDLALIAAHFPNFRMITISNAGHWPHVENPPEFLAQLRSILSPREGGSAHENERP